MPRDRRRRRLPRFDSRIFNDDQALGTALAILLDADPRMHRHRRRIIRLQTRLHAEVNERAWLAYLNVEEATMARFTDALTVVAGWAYQQARRRRR